MDDAAAATMWRDPQVGVTRPVLGIVGLVLIGAIVAAATLNWQLALVLVAVVAVALLVLGPNRLRALFGWKLPRLEIARTGYALGAKPVAVYLRKPRRTADVSDCRVEGRIVCEERATYTRGTNSYTDTRTVFEQRVAGPGQGTADGLRAEVVLDISAHAGAPTFDLGDNEVRWFVELHAVGPRLPRDKHTFLVDVAPALDARYRQGLQDS